MGKRKPQSTNLSRRSFVASAGAIGAGALFGLTSCAPRSGDDTTSVATEGTQPPESSTTSIDGVWSLDPIGEAEETITADICIIGGGGTGLAAATQSAELGLKPIIIEKLGGYGGSFVGTEFIHAVASKQQKETGVEDSVTEVVHDHLVYHHWIPRKDIAESLFEQAADTIEWLEGHGVKFEFAAGYKNRALAYHDGGEPLRGSHFIKVMSEAAERLGVEAHFNTSARKVVTEDNAVTGVLAEKKDGTVVLIETKAVVIATGGYSNNDDFLRSVSVTENENIQALGMDCRHADGIKMAADAGADMAEGMGTIQWCGPVVIGAITASWQTDGYAAGVQPTLWLNQDAERFVAEDLWSENFSGAGISIRNQKKTYAMFTESDMEYWENSGPYITTFGFATVGTPMTEARSILESCNACHVGDTIEDVAEAAGLDPEALKATISRYNGFCEKSTTVEGSDTSIDEDFGKKAEHLRALAAGPYWLCETANGYFATHGGIRVNAGAEVLNTDGEVIPGLYSGGCDAGGIQGDSYDVMYAPGSTSGWAINSGRNAARSAYEYLDR